MYIIMEQVITNILESFDSVEIIEDLQENDYDPYGNKRIFKYWFMNSKIYTMEIFDKEGFNKMRFRGALFLLPNGSKQFTHNRTLTIRTLFEILTKK